MPKVKKSSYPKSIETYKNDPQFYEELAILKAQEKIAELMKSSNTTRTKLATLLNQSKAHVTELLSDGRNLTLRTFARVCFHLNAEIDFHTYLIGSKHSAKNITSDINFDNISVFIRFADRVSTKGWISIDDWMPTYDGKSIYEGNMFPNITDNKKTDTYNMNQLNKMNNKYSSSKVA